MVLELLWKNKWLGIEEVAGLILRGEKLILYGKLLTRKQ